MISMFALWIVVFILGAKRSKWALPLAIVTIVWSTILLRLHMTDPIDLNF